MEEYEEALRRSKKRTQLATNVASGKTWEATSHAKYTTEFNITERGYRGYDLKTTPFNPITGERGEPTYREFKTGNSPLSDVQEEFRRKHKKNYSEERG